MVPFRLECPRAATVRRGARRDLASHPGSGPPPHREQALATVTGPRSPMFAPTRQTPRRRGLRMVGLAIAIVLALAALWVAMIGGLWVYAWAKLGGVELSSLDGEVTPLGVTGARAPAEATTVLVAMTGPVDPTVPRPSELVAPVVLVQYGGPRSEPAALVLAEELTTTVDGAGELTFAEVQLAGGEDLLVRAVTDYTEIRIDHVVSVSSDALPRLLETFGDLEVCGPGGCGQPTTEQLLVALAQSQDTEYVRTVAATVRAAADRVELTWVLRSPIAAKRVIDVVSEEITTDVSLRGARLLAVADALQAAGELDVGEVPHIVNPSSGGIVPLEEPAAVQFQHLRDGTPLTPQDEAETEEALVSDVRVAILNGAGIDGLAGRVQLQLETAGYVVVGTGNAPSFDRTTTVVNYVEGDPMVEYVAVLLAEKLGGASLEPVAQEPTFEGEPVDVLVTAGEDLDG
jgi:hypothetical protein